MVVGWRKHNSIESSSVERDVMCAMVMLHGCLLGMVIKPSWMGFLMGHIHSFHWGLTIPECLVLYTVYCIYVCVFITVYMFIHIRWHPTHIPHRSPMSNDDHSQKFMEQAINSVRFWLRHVAAGYALGSDLENHQFGWVNHISFHQKWTIFHSYVKYVK